MRLTRLQTFRAARTLLIAGAALAAFGAQAQAQASYVTGTVVDTSGSSLGYLIRIAPPIATARRTAGC